jgi:two-component system, sensor histidine kinase PdtaS
MIVTTLERWRHARNWGYGFAIAAFAVAFAVRYGLRDWLPPGLPFITFYPAVILTGFFTGFGPAVLVAVLSVFAGWYFFLPPFQSFDVASVDVVALGVFALSSALIIFLVHTLNVAIERLRNEREKARALAEQREALFAELQHRISNNLQIVASLLHLDTAQVADERAKEILSQASRRLELIGKLHRKLYDPQGGAIDFGEFLKGICDDIVSSWNVADVECIVKSIMVELPADQAIPVALITTELISNSLEHGLAGRKRGRINVDLRRNGGNSFVLEVADDGQGLPPGFDLASTKSLGLNIVQILTKQLAGRFEMQGIGGTTSRITIPERIRPDAAAPP